MAERPIIKSYAGPLDIVIDQGATLPITLFWEDEAGTLVAGMTNWKARLYVKKKLSDTDTLLELTTENGGITLGVTDGQIDIYMSATATAAITWKRGVYHLEIESTDGTVKRLLEGVVMVSMEVVK